MRTTDSGSVSQVQYMLNNETDWTTVGGGDYSGNLFSIRPAESITMLMRVSTYDGQESVYNITGGIYGSRGIFCDDGGPVVCFVQPRKGSYFNYTPSATVTLNTSGNGMVTFVQILPYKNYSIKIPAPQHRFPIFEFTDVFMRSAWRWYKRQLSKDTVKRHLSSIFYHGIISFN